MSVLPPLCKSLHQPGPAQAEGQTAAFEAAGAGEPLSGGPQVAGATGGSVQAEWQAISQRVQMDLETSSQSWGDRAASLLQNVTEVNRGKYDYSDFLRKFAVLGKDMQINDDEFDYIFYTYGLRLYENIPLIDPLEYKEIRKDRKSVV